MASKQNEAKKTFLRRYQVLLRREQHLQQEIEAIRSRYTGQAITYSDMPHGTDQHDLSDFAAEVDDLLRELEATKWQVIHQYHLIASSIEALEADDEREKEVLRLRYLQDMEWQDIADAMGWDRVTIWRVHGNALMHFETP